MSTNAQTPTTLNQIIGNRTALERIRTEIDLWSGLGGCIFMLQGASGNGKTLIADILAGMADGDVYRPDCTKDEDTGKIIEHLKTIACVPSMFGGLSTFIFDECDKLSSDNIAKLKITCDMIDRRRKDGADVSALVIFTTAKKKEELHHEVRKHWDELVTRCALCPVGITRDEFNDYFAKATGGACENIGWKIPVQSVRSAWEYVHANKLPIMNVEASESDIDWTLPAPGMPKKRAEFIHTSERSHRRSNAPKKQQGLVSIIRQIVESAQEPLAVATIRVALDESGEYEFKKGVEGWRRTNQIHSAIANHIKTHGESAILRKTSDGRITVR